MLFAYQLNIPDNHLITISIIVLLISSVAIMVVKAYIDEVKVKTLIRAKKINDQNNSQGYQEGYDDGVKEGGGRSEIYISYLKNQRDSAYNQGYDNGKKDGHKTGWDKAVAKMEENAANANVAEYALNKQTGQIEFVYKPLIRP